MKFSTKRLVINSNLKKFYVISCTLSIKESSDVKVLRWTFARHPIGHIEFTKNISNFIVLRFHFYTSTHE